MIDFIERLVTGPGLVRRGITGWAPHGLGLVLVLALVALPMRFGMPSIVRAAPSNSVTNLNDSGPGSLRQAIADAAPGDTITFAVGGTILLSSGQLVVAKNLTLSGPGAASLAISGNKANIALASRVFNNSAHLTITGLTLRDGDAGPGSGGGVLNASGGVLTIANSVVTGNQAQKGAGVFNSAGGQLQIANSTFSANSTRPFDAGLDASGAGIYNAGVASITGSTFSFNNVHDHGSGLYNDATATVANSTFSLGQSATAALYNNGGALHLNNVTVTLNTGKRQANGLFAAAGSVTVANSLIAGNASISNPLPDCAGPITSGGHNLIGNATGCALSAGAGDLLGSEVAPINARLGPLTANGGPTSTHTLLVGSPAIDAGSPAAPGSGGSACEAGDQRGVGRPAFGATSLTCDIGAVEIGGPLPPTSTSTVTLTPLPPTSTATATPTGTLTLPTSTPTATDTPLPPTSTATATLTSTVTSPTSTPTDTGTPLAATSTPTATGTQAVPTSTPTATPVTPKWFLYLPVVLR